MALRWTRVAEMKPFTVGVNVRARIVRSAPPRRLDTRDGRAVERQSLEVEDPEGGPRAHLVLWGEDAGRFRLGNVVEVLGGTVGIYGRRIELSPGSGRVRLAPRKA